MSQMQDKVLADRLRAENERLRDEIDGKGGWREVTNMLRQSEARLREALRAIANDAERALCNGSNLNHEGANVIRGIRDKARDVLEGKSCDGD